jgi:hypothetical protein
MTEVRNFDQVNVILGPKNGKYPYGNSIVVEDDTTASIAPRANTSPSRSPDRTQH